MLLFASMLALVPTLYFLHVLTLRIKNVHADIKLIPEDKSWLEILIGVIYFMIGSLVQESTSLKNNFNASMHYEKFNKIFISGVISPTHKTTRFLIILWWAMSMIVANIYVGFLVSYLAVPTLSNSIENLRDLSSKSHSIKCTFRKSSALHDLFMVS